MLRFRVVVAGKNAKLAGSATVAGGRSNLSTNSSPPPPSNKRLGFMHHVKHSGPRFLAYYALAWGSTGACAYAGISLFGSNATLNLLRDMGAGSLFDLNAISGPNANLLSAWLVTELLEPVRFPAVVYMVSRHSKSELPVTTNNSAADVPVEKRGNFLTRQWYALRDTAQKYGKFFLVYYTGVWISTGVLSVGLMEYFGSETALNLLGDWVSIDVSKFNPRFVNIGVGLAINEVIEPIRFPFGVLTVKPMYNLYQRLRAGKKEEEGRKD